MSPNQNHQRLNSSGLRQRNNHPAPPVIFIAPPIAEGYDDAPTSPDRRSNKNNAEPQLRITKPAAEAARRANLTDAAIRDVMENATQVGPDRDNPGRTRFTKGAVVVVTGKDGMVLGVFKR